MKQTAGFANGADATVSQSGEGNIVIDNETEQLCMLLQMLLKNIVTDKADDSV